MKYLILILFISSLAQAKPIDIQKLSKKDGFAAEVEGSINYERGFNTKTEVIGESVVAFQNQEFGLVLIARIKLRQCDPVIKI